MKYPLMTLKLHFLLFLCISILLSSDIYGEKKVKKNKESKTHKIVNQHLEWASDYYQKNQFIKSNQMAFKGLRLLGTKGDPLQQFQLYNFLAANFTRIYKDDSAIYAFEKANQLIKDNPQLVKENSLYIASLWGNQCVFYRSIHNYTLALNFALKGLEITKKYHLKNYSIVIANHLANVYELMTDYNKADGIYKKMQLNELSSENEKINIYSSMGWNELKMSKYERAVSSFTKALKKYEILEKNKQISVDIERQTKLYYQLGLGYSLKKCINKSDYYLNKGIEIPNHKNISLAKCYGQKAQNTVSLGNIQEGLALIQKGLIAIVFEFEENDITKNPSLSQTILGENTLFQLLATKAQLLHKRYQQTQQTQYLQLAAKTYQLAINLAENYREDIDAHEDKLIFTQNNSKIFDEALAVVYEWYAQNPNIEKASMFLNMVESRKSVVYNDYIKQEQIKIPTRFAPLLQQQNLLKHENAQLKQAILQGGVKIDSLKNLLQANEIALSSLKNKLTSIYPTKKHNQGNAFSIKELLTQIPEHTTYLNYDFSTNNQIYILLLNHDACSIKKIAFPPSSTHKMNQLLFKLRKNPSLMAYTGRQEAIALYKLLIKPIEKSLSSTNRLVICRDGILNYLPFEVLEEGKIQEDYLVKKMAVTYTFSAIDYVLKQHQTIDYKPKMLNMMPFLTNCILANGDTLKALRNTIISSRTPGMILGHLATKSQFLKSLNQYNQLNLVTHSTMGIQNPEKAHLYFYPDSLRQDYQLGFYEILALLLQKQQLVIIASCNSANGTLQAHEGTISLAYAFMRAGSGAVVGASWEAHNRASIIITEKFQQYLTEGYSKDVALQKAKLDFMKSSKSRDLNHPYYWANLSLIGNNQPLSHHQSFGWAYFSGIFVLLGMGIFIKTNLPKKSATIT
jgi:CHAT domain-containing protein